MKSYFSGMSNTDVNLISVFFVKPVSTNKIKNKISNSFYIEAFDKGRQ